MTAWPTASPTRSRTVARVGSQTPRVRSSPPYATSLGDEAADLMAEIGKPLMPWQREILRDAFGRRADGKWASFEVGLFMPRQNGKGVIIEAMELYGLFILRESQIIHSAHLFSTSQKSFQRLKELIDGSAWFRKRVAKVSSAHGKEGFTLTPAMGGGQLEYKARTMHAARGFSGDRIVLDEAYSLQAGNMSAMTPTLLTLPNSQLTYFSSPPDDDTGPMPEDAFLPSVRDRGEKGHGRITYWEWSPPEKAAPADVDVWYSCNPSLGYLIDEESLADQFTIYEGAGKLDKFSTEMLGAWPNTAGRQWAVISEDAWTDALDEGSRMQVTAGQANPIVISAWISPDREHGAVAVVGPRADGDLHGEVIEHRGKTTWMHDRIVKIVKKWRPARLAIDAGGATGSLVADLTSALVPEFLEEITLLTSRDVAKGYGSFVDAIDPQDQAEAEAATNSLDEGDEPGPAGTVEPVKRLWVREKAPFPATTAVAGATTRKIGDGTTWDSRDGTVDISPLRSLTDALQGFLTLPKPEPVYPAASANVTQAPAGNFWRSTTRLNL